MDDSSKNKHRRRSRSPQHEKQKDPHSRRCRGHEEKNALRLENALRRSRSRSSLSSSSDERSKPSSVMTANPGSSASGKAAKFAVKPSLIKLKLVAPAKPAQTALSKLTVASAFNNESEDEVEEMPPEAKMRMKNIGKDTKTSSGPNSFGKTKEGFVDSKKMFEKKMQQMLDLE